MRIRSMVLCALFAALFCICAWISIPVGDITITLQTFALFLALELLGGKGSCTVCLIYLLLGAADLPVFSGFRGGLGALLGATGGYITGFLAAALVYWAMSAVRSTFPFRIAAQLLGLLTCYAFGTLWFWGMYLPSGNAVGLGVVLLKCVIPYLLPDGIKLVLAFLLVKRLRRHL